MSNTTIVKTESGSTYVIDRAKMTWDRMRTLPNDSILPVRTKGGTLNTLPMVELGKPLILIGPSLTPGGLFRMIETSPIISIKEEDEDLSV